MKVNQLITNNINKLDTVIPFNKSLESLVYQDQVKQLFVKQLVKNQKND